MLRETLFWYQAWEQNIQPLIAIGKSLIHRNLYNVSICVYFRVLLFVKINNIPSYIFLKNGTTLSLHVDSSPPVCVQVLCPVFFKISLVLLPHVFSFTQSERLQRYLITFYVFCTRAFLSISKSCHLLPLLSLSSGCVVVPSVSHGCFYWLFVVFRSLIAR